MIFGLYTKKELENEIAQRMHEEYVRRQMQEDLDGLRNHLAKLDADFFDFRMKVEAKEMQKTCLCGS